MMNECLFRCQKMESMQLKTARGSCCYYLTPLMHTHREANIKQQLLAKQTGNVDYTRNNCIELILITVENNVLAYFVLHLPG